MRKYKFRGWDATGQKGWVYGDLAHVKGISKDAKEDLYDRVMVGGYEVVPESVGQFTGWTAKGKELYEGDIIGFDDWAFTSRQRKKMQHHEGEIKWSDEYGKYQIWCDDGIYEANDVADPVFIDTIYERNKK